MVQVSLTAVILQVVCLPVFLMLPLLGYLQVPAYYQLALHLRAKGEIAASGKVVQAGMELAKAQNNKHTFAELEFLLEELE